MRRRSTTNGLIIGDSRMLQDTVGLLLEPECGAAIQALGTALSRVESCRTRSASSRSELVIGMLGLVGNTNSAVTFACQGFLRTRL